MLVALGWCVSFAWLGLRHPLAAGALLLIPCTFPIGFLLVGVSDASRTRDIVLLFAWFVGIPFVIAILFAVAGVLGVRERRLRKRSNDVQVQRLPHGADLAGSAGELISGVGDD